MGLGQNRLGLEEGENKRRGLSAVENTSSFEKKLLL
jgi:hypothetical protein